VAYDLDWNKILSKIIDAGLLKVIDPENISILYRIGTRWHLACYLPENVANTVILESIKVELTDRFFSLSKELISEKDISTHLFTYQRKKFNPAPLSSTNQWIQGLCPGGDPLGLISMTLGSETLQINENDEFVSTIVNILSTSLDNAQEHHQLKELTLIDGLTGVLNQKGFREHIEREFHKAKRYNKHFSLFMIDLDDFKQINDYHGHLAGDFILQEFSNCMKSSLRKTDIVARFGGDEFVVILPETEEDHAKVLIQRLCATLDHQTYNWKGHQIKVAFSYGLACDKEFSTLDSVDELISAADYRLYLKKRTHSLDDFSSTGQNFDTPMALKQA
jgi:diguanylate cyclase (GGDEF)-like protein